MSGCEHDLLAIQALIDGELDATHAAEIEARIAACPDCAAEHERLLALRAALRAPIMRVSAPESLRARLADIAEAEREVSPPAARKRSRPPWGWLSGSAGAAIAAGFALFVIGEQAGQQAMLADALVSAHVRSLQPGHLVDVVTSDQHVVKPWFDGKLDFAPPVTDLKAVGFPIIGGRLDYVDRRPVAALAYGRGRHTINLFVWPVGQGDPSPKTLQRQGYGLRHWRADGMSFWAVSDVNPADLALFEKDLKAAEGD